jgi:hypothetical protein
MKRDCVAPMRLEFFSKSFVFQHIVFAKKISAVLFGFDRTGLQIFSAHTFICIDQSVCGTVMGVD